MIKIQTIKDKDGFIWQFIIKGHSGYGKKGSDIVCAAVSAISYTIVGSLSGLVKLRKRDLLEERDGYMMCSIPYEKMINMPNRKKRTVRTIMETGLIGFKLIQEEYKKYVKVIEEDCS